MKKIFALFLAIAMFFAFPTSVVGASLGVQYKSSNVDYSYYISYEEILEFLGVQYKSSNIDCPYYISHKEILRLNEFVVLENYTFVVSEEGFTELTGAEIEKLQELLIVTNDLVDYLLSQVSRESGTYFATESYIVIKDVSFVDSSQEISSFSSPGGFTDVTVNGLIILVRLSANTINNIGAGVAIGGIWVPHALAARALATLGVMGTQVTRGIWFEAGVQINPFGTNTPVMRAGWQ